MDFCGKYGFLEKDGNFRIVFGRNFKSLILLSKSAPTELPSRLTKKSSLAFGGVRKALARLESGITKKSVFVTKNPYFRRKIRIFDEKSVFSTKNHGFRSFTFETKRYGHGIGTTRNFEKIVAQVINDIEMGFRGADFFGGVRFFQLFLENHDGSFELG